MKFQRYKKDERDIGLDIALEPGEDEIEALAAIAQASFELATGPGVFFYGAELEDPERFVKLDADPHEPVLHMDYVHFRQCKTNIYRRGKPRFFRMNLSYYRYRESDRTPEEMLERANEILHGESELQPHPAAVQYRGEALSDLLEKEGFTRDENEPDLDFIERVFPFLYQRNSELALTILFGTEDFDKSITPSPKAKFPELQKFVSGLGMDPVPEFIEA